MLIDCGTCTVRGMACPDCVVTFLTIGVRGTAEAPDERWPVAGPPAAQVVDLDEAERAAIVVLSSSGLVPPLRLAPGRPARPDRSARPGPRRSRTG